METKLKQEPVADGGGLPPLDVTDEDRELANNIWPGFYKEHGGDALTSDLLCSLIRRYMDYQSCRERQLASSQEALRVNSATMCEAIESHSDLRERMQQAVLELKRCDLNDPMHNPFEVIQIRKAIKTLSPEGSSR